MNLDRELQYEILTQLREYYPEQIEIHKLSISEQNEHQLQFNLWYLHDHDLIKGLSTRTIGVPAEIIAAQIGVKGLDFLEDDGGLSAILNIVTIRFEAENIRKILEDKIISATISPEQKKTLKQKIQGMSGDVLKDVITEMMTKGLENPAILTILIDMLSKL